MALSVPVTVRLAPASSQPVTVAYATADGPEAGSTVAAATAGSHYTAVSGTLTFSPGQTTKTVVIPVLQLQPGAVRRAFRLVLSSPSGAGLGDPVGVVTITLPGGSGGGEPGNGEGGGLWYDRFVWTYDTVMDPASGYLGPASGPHARKVPYHCVEGVIVEAPDWGHCTTSEAGSCLVLFAAYNALLRGDTAGLNAAWNTVWNVFVPSAANQPIGSYNPDHPADYTPDARTWAETPVPGQPDAPVGADPLYAERVAAWGTKLIKCMHWYVDVDGIYLYRNGDGTIVCVYVNNFMRGEIESGLETVTHSCWDDWANGGTAYGWRPIYNAGDSTTWAKQFSYSCAPDAEVRLIAALGMAVLAGNASAFAAIIAQAKEMGHSVQYALYDKYFRNPGTDGSGCHYLISWGMGWGGEIPAAGGTSSWAFIIGNSHCHTGYNGVDLAYLMSPSAGRGFVPTSAAGARWEISVSRQLEFLRFCQSPEGAFAGGVTSCWNGRYETPTDGRQLVTFYGMYYTCTPSWRRPYSNNWPGFQGWGGVRLAQVFVWTAAGTSQFDQDVRYRCKVLLDRHVKWLLDNIVANDTTLSVPVDLDWTSPVEVVGETTTAPNPEGKYEYLPSAAWAGGDAAAYAAFWDASTVPNTHLHCRVAAVGLDLGSAADMARELTLYADACRKMPGGALTNSIPGSSYTVQDALDRAVAIMERIWTDHRDAIGFATPEIRADYNQLDNAIYIPPGVTGTMKNGDVLQNGVSTFASIRSFYQSAPEWPAIQAYLDGGDPPTLTYHRFWQQVSVGSGFAALHHHFRDILYSP